MGIVNLSKILKKFSSGWVALSSDYKSVVASGKTLKEVSGRIEKIGRSDVVLISAAKNFGMI